MSKTWYPVINHALCTECGACVRKCTHGVYDKERGPKPVVILPEGCVHGCKGCGTLCPSGAIEYFGDSTKKTPNACECSSCSDCSGCAS